MADKKDAKKESAKVEGLLGTSILWQEYVVLIIIFGVIFASVTGTMLFSSAGVDMLWARLVLWFIPIGLVLFDWFSVISIALTIFFSIGIAIVFFKMDKIGTAEHAKYYPSEKTESPEYTSALPEKPLNPKWQSIKEHIASDKANDWKIAILEADIMLGEMLERSGYQGEGIGEMLKSVEKSDFLTLDNAWEAHKIRNMIAHEGQDFVLTEREAKRVIELYRSVFDEFGLI